MFCVYFWNIKSATGLYVTLTVSLSRNTSMLVKQTSIHCLLEQTVCVMYNYKSNLTVLKLQRLACIYIIQQFITAETLLSSKASYFIEMLSTDAAAHKWRWPWNPLKSNERCTHHTANKRPIFQDWDHKYQDQDQDLASQDQDRIKLGLECSGLLIKRSWVFKFLVGAKLYNNLR